MLPISWRLRLRTDDASRMRSLAGVNSENPLWPRSRGTSPRKQPRMHLFFRLILNQGRKHRQPQVERRVVLLCFDVDGPGVARTAATQFNAYCSGIALLVEELLPLVIGRPPAVAAVIPAGYPRIGSGSKCDAIGHCALPSPQKGGFNVPRKIPTPAPRHRTVCAKKGHMGRSSDRVSRRVSRREQCGMASAKPVMRAVDCICWNHLWRARGRRSPEPALPVER